MKETFEKLYDIENIDEKLVRNVEIKVEQLIEEINRNDKKDKVKISCVGIYNAGKSTLLNTLIGRQIFKEGDIPTTNAIDIFETDNVIYYDTPGLNANDEDNECAYDGYKESDVILFVSNIQNGGLSAAEAHYLKQIKTMMGNNNILKDNILFLLSNKHRMNEEEGKKVAQQYKKNIKEVLELEIDQIYLYDAVTYKNGIDQGEQILIEASGFKQLNTVLNELIESKNKNISHLRKERLRVKREDAQKAVDTLIMQIKNNIEKLRCDVCNSQKKVKEIEVIQQRYNDNLKEFLNNLVVSDEAPRKSYIYFDPISPIYDKKSKYDVKSYIKSKVESRYDKRESMVRNEVRNLAEYYTEYLEYKENEENYYYKENLRATKLVLDYASKLKEFGIKLSPSLLQQIQIIPKNTKDILSAMRTDLADDVVQYGEYYSVNYYAGLVDIDESEDYSRKGIFGGTKYTYSAWSLHEATDEMQKDINSNLNNNINRLWGRIKNVIDKYNQEIKCELENKALEFNKISNMYKKMLLIDENVFIAKIIDAINPLSSYVNIPQNL